jgi:hypothetical protein
MDLMDLMDKMDLMDGMDGMDGVDGMDDGRHAAARWAHRQAHRPLPVQRFVVALRAPPEAREEGGERREETNLVPAAAAHCSASLSGVHSASGSARSERGERRKERGDESRTRRRRTLQRFAVRRPSSPFSPSGPWTGPPSEASAIRVT